MKRRLVPVLALVAILATGTLADAATPGAKKVTSRVSISYTPGVDDPADPYDQAYSKAKFSGKVKSKRVCRKGRTVKVRGIGKTKTNRRGRYSISGGAAKAPAGSYRAVVKKKTVKGGKVICKRARSKRVTVS